jgi:hypothetical protein
MISLLPEVAERDDRVLPVTRIVAACVVPFLVLAFAVLYFRPDLSGERFAWKIQPTFTAFWIGTGYLGGAWYFASVVRAKRWHEVSLGLPPVCAFVWVMLAATVLHWERFDVHHLPFQLWLILYVVTPLLIPGLWFANRRRDPIQPDAGAAIVPSRVRTAMAWIGGMLVAVALWMFMFPQAAIGVWAWKLTPLTARVMAGWFSLSGVGGLVLANEPRWSAWRVLLQSMMVWLALLTLGIWRAWAEFDLTRPAFAAVIAVPLSLLGLALLYREQERTAAAAQKPRPTTAAG